MKSHSLVCTDLDVYGLQAQVKANYNEFDKYNYRRTAVGTPHKEMEDIWVRYNDVQPFIKKGSLAGFDAEHDSMWYPVLDKLPSAKKIALDIMQRVEGERLGGVLITKLPPGGKIDKHVDSGWHARYYDKFYVPLLTKVGDVFCFDDGKIDGNCGEAWWFNNALPHWVENNTDSDRIAMIVCIRTDKFVTDNPDRLV